jgi:hypothetical protein
MYVYRTVMYRETLWNQPGEEQMSRKYSSTIVARSKWIGTPSANDMLEIKKLIHNILRSREQGRKG